MRNVSEECNVPFPPLFSPTGTSSCHFKTSVISTNGFKANEVLAGSKSQVVCYFLPPQPLLSLALTVHPSALMLWVCVDTIAFHSFSKNFSARNSKDGSGWLEFLPCLSPQLPSPLTALSTSQPAMTFNVTKRKENERNSTSTVLCSGWAEPTRHAFISLSLCPFLPFYALFLELNHNQAWI